MSDELMRCIEIKGMGGPDVLKETERPRPKPTKGEILIKVMAAGVNRPDVLQRKGLYKRPENSSDLPGLEVSGEIVEIGEGVDGFLKGDHVCALSPGGGYSDYCIVPCEQVLTIPKGLDFIQAAALPEVCFTIWYNLFIKGALAKNQSLLIHGGSSGIGTMAIQLAKALGISVYVTAGTAEKCQACLELGADLAINYREQDFVEMIETKTDGLGVNMILDMVGADYVAKNFSALAQGGHLVNIFFLNGSRVDIDLMPILSKGLTFTGSLLRPQPLELKKKIRDDLEQYVWPLIEAGKMAPVIYKTFSLNEASKAHELMESSRHIGKIILTC
ncbi:NAD(P)H-quinone oxidoreductase [Lentisphaera profundi]|uniref:NAD(P)H-quinone oxidoreductase n=1 Tax=Lentisphaera profundi TaxID=1658616 RepID=A0ABY7VQ06_9BACT|nr:NAD(P)H-quinone oxidoreductase [Lentisphaera profundi]WDE95911.1 NAD(P)H-quinone oxidoreductase [Lentisphaera profundi]